MEMTEIKQDERNARTVYAAGSEEERKRQEDEVDRAKEEQSGWTGSVG